MNTATLFFRKLHVSGLLKGITGNVESITFPTPEACMKWVEAINRKADARRLSWRVADRSFQNFDREGRAA